ncbi:MAG: hypothetical protein M3N54_13265, partial [Acidobacteriota bacterium]|nr:hypothetical protein [Acidobacteriota bacterium]
LRGTPEMRSLNLSLLMALSVLTLSAKDRERDFSGSWRLNAARTDIRTRFDVPSGFLRVTQNTTAMAVSASEQEGEEATNMVIRWGTNRSGAKPAVSLLTSRPSGRVRRCLRA